MDFLVPATGSVTQEQCALFNAARKRILDALPGTGTESTQDILTTGFLTFSALDQSVSLLCLLLLDQPIIVLTIDALIQKEEEGTFEISLSEGENGSALGIPELLLYLLGREFLFHIGGEDAEGENEYEGEAENDHFGTHGDIVA